MEAPQTNGWSTEEIAGTRSGITKTVKQKGEYDLNMEVSTLYYPAGYATDEAATRWANMEDNITFRVIAYKSATATEISTANYAGYGDYKLSGSSVQTTKSLSFSLWELIHSSFIHTAIQAPLPHLPTALQVFP